MNKRPNILFLMTDQQRHDLVGFAGNSIIRTPNLDKLAKEGAVFENAYTPSPICIPARQCLMAGQLPRTCGVTTYGEDLSPNYMTFSKLLSQYAYDTVCCGKLHHMGIDQNQGWTNRIGWDGGVESKYIDGCNEESYDTLKSRSDLWWPWAKEIKKAGIGKSPHVIVDEYSVQGALLWLEERFVSDHYEKANHDKPVLLKVSLRSPHYPYATDEKRFNYYLDKVKPFIQENSSNHSSLKYNKVKNGIEVSKDEIRNATAAYYGMMENADDLFGQVINKLEAVGQNIDDWFIIFTSDHGDMLGEKGLWMKTLYYDSSAKVPLFIRYPREFKQGQRITQNVNLCDLFATICDACDIPIPKGLDSNSLIPLLKGDSINWKNEVISEFQDSIMIKQDELKYIYYPNASEILFDLKNDPEELKNEINNPKYQESIKKFKERIKEL